MLDMTADANEMRKDAITLYQLYNIYGRGRIDEVSFCTMFIKDTLGEWIKQNYSREEIEERMRLIDGKYQCHRYM